MMRCFRLALSSTTGQLERVGFEFSNPGGGSPPPLALFANAAAAGDEMTTSSGGRVTPSLTDADIQAQVVAESQRVFAALLNKRVRMTAAYMLESYNKAKRAGASLRRRLEKERAR